MVGFLGGASPAPNEPALAAFRQGLSETGYVEGRNWRSNTAGQRAGIDRLPGLAADYVGRKVDVIATAGGTPAALAAKNATSTIPVVFAFVGDPVGAGLIASLARPGGNVTVGIMSATELTPKRLELLAEVVPQAGVIALLVNPNNASAEPQMRDVQGAARA